MALAYLVSDGEINFNPDKRIFLGELSLNGDLRPIKELCFNRRSKKAWFLRNIFTPRKCKRARALCRRNKNIWGKEFKRSS